MIIEIDNILDVEKQLDGIELVIFDLDDTLYSEKEYVHSGYHAVAQKFPDLVDMEARMWKAFEDGKPAIDVVLEEAGMMDLKAKALDIYRRHDPNIHLYEGVAAMLERIAESRKLAILTDGRPEGQRAKLRALGLETIPHIITDELGGVEYRKPCDKAYRMLLEQFDVPAERAVYVGDNTKKDFDAPETLKMKSIHLRNENGLYHGKKLHNER